MPLELARISSADLEALARDQTVFFFAVGPVEDHGPHLPLGMDLLEAQELCRMAALKLETEMPGWRGVIMPAAPLGIESNTTALAITVRPHVLRDWLVDSSRSLSRLGFRHFVCFTGHLGPRQLTAIEEAGSIISRTGPIARLARMLSRSAPVTLVSASSALVSASQVRESPFFADPQEHGGKRDTSIALALGLESAIQKATKQERPARTHVARLVLRAQRKLKGHWGDPAGATSVQGRQLLQDAVADVFTRLRATWAGANPNHLFRSWYSILPPNKSFFKAWLLAILFFAMMTAWIYINFQALTQ